VTERLRPAFLLPLALATAGCPDREPPAYPAVRYEQEPLSPPDPRAFAAGTTVAWSADAGGPGDGGAPDDASVPAR
jgi:hypothetical protein